MGDTSQSDLSMSPAALFLSSFSASPEPAAAQDGEGSIISGYQLGPVIGVGGCSTIRAATSGQGGSVAIKIVRRSDLSKHTDPALARKRLDHEAVVWGTLCHEHVLPLFSVTHTLHADYFVTLYCPAGSLFDILKRDGRPGLPRDDVGMMFRQVVRGLRYLHEGAGVVHGDMKLENVLVDEMGVCRITDFGMARTIGEREPDKSDESGEQPEQDEGARTRRVRGKTLVHSRRSHGKQGPIPAHLSLIRHHSGPRHRNSSPLPGSSPPSPSLSSRIQQGSLPYAAPELLLPPSSTPYSPHPAQDMWALGIMLYTLLSGRLPFVDSYDPRLQMKILHGVYDMPEGIGRGAERVIRGCLERSVPSRWTVAVVDDLAWCIGSDETLDDIAIAADLPSHQPLSKSRSRSRLRVQLESAAIDDAESHRSSSRATSRSSSSMRRSSRSASRYPSHPYEPYHQRRHEHHVHECPQVYPLPTQPTFSALTHAILRTGSTSSDSSVPGDSAVLMTPSNSHEAVQERERGRLPRPRSFLLAQEHLCDSRSVSPMDMPLTPRDLDAEGLPVRAGLGVRKANALSPDAGHLDPLQELGSITSGTGSEVDGLADRRSDDAVQEAGAGSHLPSARAQLWSVLKADILRSARSGSVPPAPMPYVSWTPTGSSTYSAAATPRPIPRRTHTARSRSVDWSRSTFKREKRD
ncbi:hypothetical protein IEO21_08437 [Rhodonia placenta]|uniref:Protein kinase domain-containing protein n=1 Tax=Rhodonia placenta TaxID=104341 RepID=A0A8H7NWE9_9APHY|nr:hypothetical protein IEO21_08437 [Postia placenta]